MRTNLVAVIGVSLGLLHSGCGGSEPTGTGNPPPPPPPPPPAPTMHIAAGTVYARSETIAYPAEATSTPVLAGVALRMGGVTATTASDGNYSISTTAQPEPKSNGADLLPVEASLPGYQPMWVPFLVVEAGKPVHVALYPETQVTPRPGFLKGVYGRDAGGGGGGIPGVFQNNLHVPTIARARDIVRSNVFVYPNFQRMSQLDLAAGTVTMGQPPWGGTTRAMYEAMVGEARSKGMQFMMSESITAGPGVSFTPLLTLPITDPVWDPIFAGFRAWLQQQATIARDLQVEYFMLPLYSWMTRHSLARWADLVAAIRGVGYTGKIGYSFGRNKPGSELPEVRTVPPGFIELFDWIGVSMDAGVILGPGEETGRTFSRARMRADVRTFLESLSGLPVPIILTLGTYSIHGGVSIAEFIEACLVCQPGQVAASERTRDWYQQSDMYQAVAEVINQSPTGNGRVMGLLSWQYDWWANNLLWNGTGAYDKTSAVRGKPAEAVLSWWFHRW